MDEDDSGFSGIVKISNVSDFITPSQACILPLQSKQSDMKVRIQARSRSKKVNGDAVNKVVVTLNDCLACSGCITSAETILVKEQSKPKFLEGLASAQLSVMTVSPQSIASIAYKRGCQTSEAARLIAGIFKNMGMKYVLDSSFGRLLTLSLSYDEFKEAHLQRPIFTGVCPGFVCYAEKTHGTLLIPHISRVRSPQAMMGALVKDYLARKFDVKPEKIFHASVMPCFDKKLEAARSHSGNYSDCREVDCVLSTGEVDGILDEYNATESFFASEKVGWLNALENGKVISSEGGSSGGYAEYIVKRFVAESEKPLELKRTIKDKNWEIIEAVDGETKMLSVAKCYGFRNIQIHVQKLKRSKCDYDYVEIMACPSGCINGGGQIRGASTEERKKILDAIELSCSDDNSEMEKELERVKEEWSVLNPDWMNLLYTKYYAVEKSAERISTNW
ncbi:cytosolic Fe-S cluster assembly factor [Loa loa]|uniref:Cytosolic Fe-S cluster assembly factor n=1 Tax=Loa loa TaxID=7209 RepID=A0A1S0TYF1_LOALO|nr:cytosolic Fe-S cluster assembly factor [Loa loa]EFO22045.1 cytosolic Fe-S cluster assembly factor [Loa loa]